MCFSNYFYSTENVQEGQGDLGWQGTDRHPDLWAGRQAHQEAGLGPGQVRVRNEGTGNSNYFLHLCKKFFSPLLYIMRYFTILISLTSLLNPAARQSLGDAGIENGTSPFVHPQQLNYYNVSILSTSHPIIFKAFYSQINILKAKLKMKNILLIVKKEKKK